MEILEPTKTIIDLARRRERNLYAEKVQEKRKAFENWLPEKRWCRSPRDGEKSVDDAIKATTLTLLPGTQDRLNSDSDDAKVDSYSELCGEEIDRLHSESLEGIHHEAIFVDSYAQTMILHQIERVLVPGGSISLLAIRPSEKFSCITRSMLKSNWGAPAIKKEIKTTCEQLGLTIESMEEKKVRLSKEMWLAVYDQMRAKKRNWRSVFGCSTKPKRREEMASFLASRIEITAVVFKGSKPF